MDGVKDGLDRCYNLYFVTGWKNAYVSRQWDDDAVSWFTSETQPGNALSCGSTSMPIILFQRHSILAKPLRVIGLLQDLTAVLDETIVHCGNIGGVARRMAAGQTGSMEWLGYGLFFV